MQATLTRPIYLVLYRSQHLLIAKCRPAGKADATTLYLSVGGCTTPAARHARLPHAHLSESWSFLSVSIADGLVQLSCRVRVIL